MNDGPMMEVTTPVIKTGLDRALSTPEMRDVMQTEAAPKNLRKLGEKMRVASLSFLYEQQHENRIGVNQLSMQEAIRSLHILSTPGWKLFDEDPDEEFKAGEYRTDLLQFGDKIPPHPNDVPSLMAHFGSRLSELLEDCPPDDADLLATWADSVFVAIHPFRDGNGRTGRSLVEYIRYSIARKHGTEYKPLHLSRTEEAAGEMVTDQLGQVQYELGLFNGTTDKSGNILRTAQDAYDSNPTTYFVDVADRIREGIVTTESVQDLRKYPKLAKLAEGIQTIGNWKNYETNSMAADAGAEAYSKELEFKLPKVRAELKDLARAA